MENDQGIVWFVIDEDLIINQGVPIWLRVIKESLMIKERVVDIDRGVADGGCGTELLFDGTMGISQEIYNRA